MIRSHRRLMFQRRLLLYPIHKIRLRKVCLWWHMKQSTRSTTKYNYTTIHASYSISSGTRKGKLIRLIQYYVVGELNSKLAPQKNCGFCNAMKRGKKEQPIQNIYCSDSTIYSFQTRCVNGEFFVALLGSIFEMNNV